MRISPTMRPTSPSIGMTPSQCRCPGSRPSSAGTKTSSQIPPRNLATGEATLRERNQRAPRPPRNTGSRNAPRPKPCSRRSEVSAPARPTQLRACARTGQDRGAVQRGIERRIGCQREEKKERGDTQQESDQLIEPPVVGGSEDSIEILHGRMRRHRRGRQLPQLAHDYARAF